MTGAVVLQELCEHCKKAKIKARFDVPIETPVGIVLMPIFLKVCDCDRP